jgi:transcription initiation factor TFIIB
MHDRGLSTVIGKDVDATGRVVSSSTRETFNRLRIWDQRSRTRSSSSLAKALTILNATKTKLGIPSHIFEDAASIYRKAVSAKLTRGRTMQSLVAASLYAACRRTGTPRSLDDVAGAANVAKRVLSRDLRMLIRSLDMDLNQYDTSAFVVRLANNLNLRERIKRDALDILARSEEERITVGKHPVAQAAASLYLSCIMNGEKITQKGFAQAAGVSDVTIRNRIAQIRETLQMR